jgi:uncharacterized OsmC-like protein
MDLSPFGVRATSGSLRLDQGTALEHAWTPEGIVAGPVTNGAQALHLAVAVCVLNDVWREAAARGIELRGVAVDADGGFDEEWHSTGISYAVDIATDCSPPLVAALLDAVDEVAEVPRALRAGAQVTREHPA